MISEEKIKRINELAAKHKADPDSLTEEELAERARLRREYIDSVKENLRSRLDSVKYVEDLSEEEQAKLSQQQHAAGKTGVKKPSKKNRKKKRHSH